MIAPPSGERPEDAAEAARLHQIIKELQRHRSGRRAETLPIDQLERELQDVQQTEAGEAPKRTRLFRRNSGSEG